MHSHEILHDTQFDKGTLKILLLAGMTLLIFIVLTSTLSSVTLAPGDSSLLQQLLLRLKPQTEDDQAASPTGSLLALGILRFMIFFTIIGLPFAVIYFIISPEFRRQVMRQSVRAGLLLVGLFLLIRLRLLHSLDKLWDNFLKRLANIKDHVIITTYEKQKGFLLKPSPNKGVLDMT